MLEFLAIVLCAYLVLCVVACIFQPKTPLPSLTETYKTLTIENDIEEVLVEGRQKFPPYKKLTWSGGSSTNTNQRRPIGIITDRISGCDCHHGIFAIHSRTPVTTSLACATAILPSVVPRRRCGRPTTISTRRAPGSSGRSSGSAACDCRSSRM
jgi:hypothetical protein